MQQDTAQQCQWRQNVFAAQLIAAGNTPEARLAETREWRIDMLANVHRVRF